MDNSERLKLLQAHLETKALGFAGVDRAGKIVDRRQQPDAIPMQKNDLLGIPDPSPVCFMCHKTESDNWITLMAAPRQVCSTECYDNYCEAKDMV